VEIMKTQEDDKALNIMRMSGGFGEILANLAEKADSHNLQKIKQTWPEYWINSECHETDADALTANAKVSGGGAFPPSA
jgi:hypothetical protein